MTDAEVGGDEVGAARVLARSQSDPTALALCAIGDLVVALIASDIEKVVDVS
jgi:hypothetical protein